MEKERGWLWNQTISLGGVYQRPRGLKSAFLQLMCFQVTSLRRQTTLGPRYCQILDGGLRAEAWGGREEVVSSAQ